MSQFAVDRLRMRCQMSLPGALDGPITMAIFSVVSKFCVNTNTLWEDQNFLTRVGKLEYEISASEADLYITKLHSVVHNQDNLPVGTQSVPIPIAAYLSSPTTLRLRNMPTEAQRFTMRVVLAPKPTDKFDSIPNIPESFFDKYNEAFTEGVLAEMMAQPAKPYTNERLGIFHGRRFQAMMSTAKIEAVNGELLGGQSWRFNMRGWA